MFNSLFNMRDLYLFYKYEFILKMCFTDYKADFRVSSTFFYVSLG